MEWDSDFIWWQGLLFATKDHTELTFVEYTLDDIGRQNALLPFLFLEQELIISALSQSGVAHIAYLFFKLSGDIILLLENCFLLVLEIVSGFHLLLLGGSGVAHIAYLFFKLSGDIILLLENCFLLVLEIVSGFHLLLLGGLFGFTTENVLYSAQVESIFYFSMRGQFSKNVVMVSCLVLDFYVILAARKVLALARERTIPLFSVFIRTTVAQLCLRYMTMALSSVMDLQSTRLFQLTDEWNHLDAISKRGSDMFIFIAQILYVFSEVQDLQYNLYNILAQNRFTCLLFHIDS
ncbi:hypothetical protein ACJX0J_024193 [Zea mays]